MLDLAELRIFERGSVADQQHAAEIGGGVLLFGGEATVGRSKHTLRRARRNPAIRTRRARINYAYLDEVLMAEIAN